MRSAFFQILVLTTSLQRVSIQRYKKQHNLLHLPRINSVSNISNKRFDLRIASIVVASEPTTLLSTKIELFEVVLFRKKVNHGNHLNICLSAQFITKNASAKQCAVTW